MRNLLIVLLVMLSGYVRATDFVWTNASTAPSQNKGKWGNTPQFATNWFPIGNPSSNDNVMFSRNVPENITLQTNVACLSFSKTNTISGGANFMGTAFLLKIYGNYTNATPFTTTFSCPVEMQNGGKIVNNNIGGIEFYRFLITNAPTTLVFSGGSNIFLSILATEDFAFTGDGAYIIYGFDINTSYITADLYGTLLDSGDLATPTVTFNIYNQMYGGATCYRINLKSGAVYDLLGVSTILSGGFNMESNSTVILDVYSDETGASLDITEVSPASLMAGTIKLKLVGTDDYVPMELRILSGATLTNFPVVVVDPSSDGALAGAVFVADTRYHLLRNNGGGDIIRSYRYNDINNVTNANGVGLSILHFNDGGLNVISENVNTRPKPWMGWMMNQ